MADYIVRATAKDAQIRAFACTTREIVETARKAHDTWPVATAALGRLLTAGTMMGSMLKNEKDILTIQINSSGPIKGMTVTADSKANVKGYVIEPKVDLPPNSQGKLDVGKAMGIGVMNVIKDLGLKEPYVGQTVLQTGEIGDDLTYYFATSEQVPSSVGLGVLMNKDNTVKQAGGFILQLMPFTSDEVIEKLEKPGYLAQIITRCEMKHYKGCIITWDNIYSLLVITGLVINSLCMSFKNPHNIRKSILVTSPLVLIYDIIVSSVGGAVYESIAIISAVIGIIRYSKADAQK